MDKVILIRIGEIYLKGKNRSFFENKLIATIRYRLKGFDCKLYFGRNRYIVSDYKVLDEDNIIAALKVIFGINSLSVGYKTSSDYDSIKKLVLETLPNRGGTFRISANRADKSFPLNSVQLGIELGAEVLTNNPDLSVDLHNPSFIVNVDIREDGNAYVFNNRISAAGGMPVGTSGKGLLLLSGGIDSPVAGYMMAKRGMSLSALNFHSYPYTSEMAKEKVIKLAKELKKYCGSMELIFISFTKIQEAINKYCDNSYMITILRRLMMRAAERIAISRRDECLINGESLGQVASQTLQSITVTNSIVEKLPIFRPLIGMDKHEILEISKKIGTYETSILPYEDCCTVFLPKNPVTKPNIENCLKEEAKIVDLSELLEEALSNLEIIKI